MTNPAEPIVVRGSRLQIALTFGAFVGILSCTFFVGGLYYRFASYANQQDRIVATVEQIDRRVVRAETMLENMFRDSRQQ